MGRALMKGAAGMLPSANIGFSDIDPAKAQALAAGTQPGTAFLP
jgi:hypothetical protein